MLNRKTHTQICYAKIACVAPKGLTANTKTHTHAHGCESNLLALAVSKEGRWEINKDRQSRIQLALPVGCVCVRCSNPCKEKGAEVSLRWEAREMLSSVYWNPPTMMDGHINSGIGQRLHLWWQPESGPVRLSLRTILMPLMTLCTGEGAAGVNAASHVEIRETQEERREIIERDI